jgi:hypothetical protein
LRLYSNIITPGDVYTAAATAVTCNDADVWIDEHRTFTPRANYANGIEFWAHSTNGKVASGHRPVGSYPLDDQPRAVSWSDYGYLIAHLFSLDPHARIGCYDSEADFVRQVREHPRKGQSLDFLSVLPHIREYEE